MRPARRTPSDSIKVVLPDPGELVRLKTARPRVANRCRFSAASASFLARTASSIETVRRALRTWACPWVAAIVLAVVLVVVVVFVFVRVRVQMQRGS